MKALQVVEYGPVDALDVREVAKPAVGAGQVLIHVHAAAINPFDVKVASGAMAEQLPLTVPYTIGGDVSGEVVAVGGGVSDFATGDKVFGSANVASGGSGSMAEYAVTKASELAAMPKGLSYEEAASLPLAGVSAWQALTISTKLTAGQTILIQGGSGGIGSLAIQLAHHLGARVIATATDEGVPYIEKLGADVGLDYKLGDFTKVVHDADVVFDTVGGYTRDKSVEVLKRGGVLVSMAGKPNEALVTNAGITAIAQWTKETTEALEAVAKLVEEKVMTPHIGATYLLEDGVAAYVRYTKGGILGKVVVKIA